MAQTSLPELQPGASPENIAVLPASRRRTRISVSAFYFGQGIAFASWASRIPDIKAHLGLSDAGLGTILLALPAGQLATMPFSGRLVTRFGSKKILTLAAPVYVLGLVNLGLAEKPWHLAAFLFLFGIIGNLANIAVNTQGVEAERLYTRPIMASFHGSWSLAGFCGALLGLTMIHFKIVPWPHFLVVTALVWINVLFNYKYLVQGKPAENVPAKTKGFQRPDGFLMKLGLIAFCCMATEGCMFDWSGVYFRDIVHAPDALVVLGYASFMSCMATGRFLGDRIVARWGRRNVLMASGAVISTGMALAVAFPVLPVATPAFMLVGFGVSGVIPTLYSLAGRQERVPAARALATVSSVGYFGFLLGPPLIGYISALSSLRASLGVIGCFGILVFILVSRMRAVGV
jgi:MFS family permease